MILADGRWTGAHGIGRFAKEVLQRLPVHDRIVKGPKPSSPSDPVWLSLQLRTTSCRVFFSPGYNAPLHSPIPYVFTIFDLIHLQGEGAAARLRRIYYRNIVRPAARRAQRVLTASEYSRREILEWSGLPEDRVTVVGSGVDDSYGIEGPRHDPGYPYLLYVSNRKPHKNLDRLLEAFGRIADADFRLVLTGESDNETLERIARAGATGRVVFAGYIPEAEMPALYRGATMLVSPSLMEGFGLPALEAMACGVPVVAANACSLPEVVGDAAEMVDPYDTDDIQRGIERVLRDAVLREQMRERGLDRARLFRWDDVAARVSALLS